MVVCSPHLKHQGQEKIMTEAMSMVKILFLGIEGVDDHTNKMIKASASVCLLLLATALNTVMFMLPCAYACISIHQPALQ